MIAKHVAMKSVNKSDFAELVKYMTDEQEKDERVGYVSVTNCQSDRPDAAVLEILNTQGMNTRAESDKTFHLVVSFPAGEQPANGILKEIESKLCAGLGYGEHQRVSVVHHDTDNLHIHIAINKIHPTRYTILDPYYSHKVLGQLCEKLEQEYGLTRVNHKSNKVGSENRAFDMEHHAGVESLLGWIKRECLDQMQAASSWVELHRVMQESGLELRERGNGLVITSQDGLMVKASSVARDLSKGKLEVKFGAFTPSDLLAGVAGGKRKYEARPIRSRIDTTLLFAKYRNEQTNQGGLRSQQWKLAREEKDRQIEAAKRAAKLKRATIKLAVKSRDEKKLLYSLTSKALLAEIKKANETYQSARQAIFEKHRPQQWADWLRRKAIDGDADALAALRAREAAQGLRGDTIGAAGGRGVSRVTTRPDGITKTGTIIYRVGTSAVRDDGDKLKVSRGVTANGLEAALRMAMARYGHKITVNGTDEFKTQIVKVAVAANLPLMFADSNLERQRLSFLNNTTENRNEPDHDRGRRTGGRAGGVGSTTGIADGANAGDGRRGGFFKFAAKPNVGRVGHKPPPESRNRLRDLSSLSMVRIASGIEMLLSGNVPGGMEQQTTDGDNTLRRTVFGDGLNAFVEADKYIAEREEKRLNGINNISVHRRYSESDAGTLWFAGLRRIDGKPLALLKREDVVLVMPIDEKTATYLKRLSVGDAVTVEKLGSIKISKERRR